MNNLTTLDFSYLNAYRSELQDELDAAIRTRNSGRRIRKRAT